MTIPEHNFTDCDRMACDICSPGLWDHDDTDLDGLYGDDGDLVMTNQVITAYDAIAANEPNLPLNALTAGYDTEVGSNSGIRWSAAQFARHSQPYPAIHIDQDPGASDPLADWLDVEPGAATADEIVGWLMRAQADYHSGVRPGQRWPGIYCSESNVPSIVSILIPATLSGSIQKPVPFWVANYSIGFDEAVRRVATAIGPYPAYGFQYTDQALGGLADADVFALNWVTTVSGIVTPPTTNWTDALVQNLPTLTIGNTTLSQDVRDLQSLLNGWTIPTKIDGYFGPITQANVRLFQQRKGLPVNGIVAEATWQKLLNR